MLGMCINKKVVIGVAVAAGLLWWLAPAVFAASLPFLILAICPLSMLVMMRMMNKNQDTSSPASQPEQVAPVQAQVAGDEPSGSRDPALAGQ